MTINLPTTPANRDVTLIVESLFDDLVYDARCKVPTPWWPLLLDVIGGDGNRVGQPAFRFIVPVVGDVGGWVYV